MTVLVLQIILAILGIIATTLAWLFRRQDSDRKKKDEIDKEIDAASNASDILNISGKLRNKK